MPISEEKTTPKRSTSSTAKKPVTSAAKGIDLAQLFGAAAQVLAANQGQLNQVDTANGNHGDHIVQTFQLITEAVAATQGKPPADQLAYASRKLADHAKVSGSANMYAQGLSQAANQLQGQKAITPDLAMTLVQTLLAGGQAQAPASRPGSAGADLLGQLLGGIQQPAGQTSQPSGGDMLGQLLGSLGGSQQQQPANAQDGIDLGDVLNAGMAFMQAKQSGKDNLQAAVGALMAASPLNQQPYRQQSGELVANTLLQVISSFSKK